MAPQSTSTVELGYQAGVQVGWTEAKAMRGAVRQVRIVRPAVVDVASGVADASGVKKDPAAVEAFIAAVHSAYL